MVGFLVQFAWFRVKNNLTEINHKVSLIAKGFRREIAVAFAAKCKKFGPKAEDTSNSGRTNGLAAGPYSRAAAFRS
jgi:hypothetical protein